MVNFFTSGERLTLRIVDPEDPGPRRSNTNQLLVSLTAPSSFAAEQYRVLGHLVEQRHHDHGLRLLAVTSPADGDGKTTTALNLAGALAHTPDVRVLFVDADLRKSVAADRLGLVAAGGRGLAELILDVNQGLTTAVRRCPEVNFFVLPAGRSPAAPYEALKSPRFGELLQQMRSEYDYVVLDTPPLLPVPDCRVITKRIDGVLMVVAAHRTPRRLVEEALDIIDTTKMLGLVFNGDDRPLGGYSSYYATYASGQSRNGHRTERWHWTGRTPGHRRLPHDISG